MECVLLSIYFVPRFTNLTLKKIVTLSLLGNLLLSDLLFQLPFKVGLRVACGLGAGAGRWSPAARGLDIAPSFPSCVIGGSSVP